jgi:hypothetical protein
LKANPQLCTFLNVNFEFLALILSWKSGARSQDEAQKIAHYLIMTLGAPRLAILKAILFIAKEVIQHQASNSMNPVAVARVFGPNLFHVSEIKSLTALNWYVAVFSMFFNPSSSRGLISLRNS